MPKYFVEFSGCIELEDKDKQEAERLAQKCTAIACYAGFSAYEIGKEVDELGWAIIKQENKC